MSVSILQVEKTLQILKSYYQPIPLEIFDKDPYKMLIATLMSARTNDDTTLVAATKLFEQAPTIYELNKLTEHQIQNLIFPVGFYKTKARHITKLAKIVVNKFGGTIPHTREELVTLPGVGRKTANLVLSRTFDYPAIAVDTHVHRIANLLGWVSTTTPKQTEEDLVKIIPQKYWADANKLFVSVGRQYRSTPKLETLLANHSLIVDNNRHRSV